MIAGRIVVLLFGFSDQLVHSGVKSWPTGHIAVRPLIERAIALESEAVQFFGQVTLT